MKCERAIEQIQHHLDQQLSSVEKEELDHHLQQCSSCAEMFQRLEQVSNELANLPKVVPPFNLVDAILPVLDEVDAVQEDKVSAHARAKERSFWNSKRLLPVQIAGVAVASVILFVMILNGGPREEDAATADQTLSGIQNRANSTFFVEDQVGDEKLIAENEEDSPPDKFMSKSGDANADTDKNTDDMRTTLTIRPSDEDRGTTEPADKMEPAPRYDLNNSGQDEMEQRPQSYKHSAEEAEEGQSGEGSTKDFEREQMNGFGDEVSINANNENQADVNADQELTDIERRETEMLGLNSNEALPSESEQDKELFVMSSEQGTYTAKLILEDQIQKIVIFDRENEKVWTSTQSWEVNDEIVLLYWKSENTLVYHVNDQSRLIDLSSSMTASSPEPIVKEEKPDLDTTVPAGKEHKMTNQERTR